MDYSALIGAVSGAVVLLVGKAIEWYKTRSDTKVEEKKADTDDRLREEKQRAETSIPVNEQANRILKEIIDSLKTDMAKLVDNMHYQDGLLLKCREEKLELKAEKEMLARELEIVKQRVAELETRMAEQEKKK